jgi:hypothetical protein
MVNKTIEMRLPDGAADTVMDALASITAQLEWQGFVSDEWMRVALDTEQVIQYRIKEAK